MRIVEGVAECREALAAERRAGRRIGYVPTMGYLHEGHLSLVDRAREAADVVVVSIFVNPLQFSPAEDFESYPRDRERDLALLEARGVDLAFVPAPRELIPGPLKTRVTMKGVTERYEGEVRPGHFDGVLTIVAKLFHVVRPDVAVFGQKDAQQAAAVRRMVADLDFGIEILVAPTVREEDGLAASSRNVYLSARERRAALAIPRAVARATELVAGGERDAAAIAAAMREALAAQPELSVDYAAVVDCDRFTPVDRVEGPAVAAVAARVGRTRLLDNALLDPADG